jgi:hypothetical protein
MRRSEWIRVVSSEPLTDGHTLPLRVTMGMEGLEWDAKYDGSVAIYLDNEESLVTVELETISEPFIEKVKRFLAKDKKKVAWAITIPLTLLILWLVGAPICTCQSGTPSAILGKWQHGLSQCPSNMDSKLFEKLKTLPENKPYLLEFSKNGRLLYTSEDQTCIGKYSFTGSNSVRITWDSPGGSVDPVIIGGAYEVTFSGNRMSLVQQGQSEVTLERSDD